VKALIIRNGTSGRFSPIAEALKARGWSGALINSEAGLPVDGWTNIRWNPAPIPRLSAPRPVVLYDHALRKGLGTAEAAERLKAQGFSPDIIIGHPAWGEMLLLDEVFRGVPQIHLGEYYYLSEGGDANFDPEFPSASLAQRASIRGQNAVLAQSYADASAIVAPTAFQASLFPADFRAKTRIIHEGIDTARTTPRRADSITLPGGKQLSAARPYISFVNRRFEPMRGFHVFMRMLPRLQALAPELDIVLVGADEPEHAYGVRPTTAACWREAMLAEVGDRLDMARVHFVPPMPYQDLLVLLSNAAAHVYMTYPFVLSWSLLDAMACEALVVASDTAPVRDAITHGRDGLLVDFFDQEGWAETLAAVVRDPEPYRPLRAAARQRVITAFDRQTICMPAWMTLVDDVLR